MKYNKENLESHFSTHSMSYHHILKMFSDIVDVSFIRNLSTLHAKIKVVFQKCCFVRMDFFEQSGIKGKAWDVRGDEKNIATF